MNQAQKESLAATKTIVNIAVNYGGRQEILQAYSVLRSKAAVGKSSRRRLRWNKSAAVCIRLGSRTRI